MPESEPQASLAGSQGRRTCEAKYIYPYSCDNAPANAGIVRVPVRESIQRPDPDILPAHSIEPSIWHAVHLQADKTSRICFIDFFVRQVLDGMTIHPRADARSFSEDSHLIPTFIE